MILMHVYEDEVIPTGRKRGTSVVTEFFQVHFPNSGTLILIDMLISNKRHISTSSKDSEFSLRESLI